MSIDNVTIHQGYELPNGTNTLAHDVVRLINALTSIDSDVFLRPLASSSTYVGTTAIALNRASAAQALTGITSIDGSAASLTTSRTLWGQSFNGSANVTGSLTSVGNITGSGAISLTTAAASNLSLTSGTTGVVSLDSGTTGAVNIGTGANTKIITIGSSTGTVQLPTAVTKVGQTFLIQGGAGNVTFPTTPGTLLGSNDVGSVTSTMILNATIVNADISPSAAIAGTKISPDFGSQNVTTTGTSTAASFIPSSATVPTNGVYLPAANSVAISTNGTRRLDVNSSGQFRIGDGGVWGALSVQAATNANLHIRDINTLTAGTGVALDVLNDAGSVVNSLAVRGATIIFLNASSEVMRLTSTGLVGLGTSAPSGKLHVIGDSATAGVGNINISNAAFPTSGWAFRIPDSGSTIDLSLDGAVGGTFRSVMYFARGTGNVGIGTTSPSSLLHLADAGNITVGTTTGTKIGTAITQKIGFYNATPVVQPTAVADATTAIDVITQLNALLAKLRTLGIIAT